MNHIIRSFNLKTIGLWFDEDFLRIRKGALTIEALRKGNLILARTYTGDRLIREEALTIK